MSCGARGRLHFTSLILENLNKRAALYVHQRCEKEVIRPGRIPRVVKSQGAWRRHHRHCPPTRCLVATTMSMANNRHLLNTNCVHLPWHEQSENVSPRAPGTPEAPRPLHVPTQGGCAWCHCSNQNCHYDLLSKAFLSSRGQQTFSIKGEIVNTFILPTIRFLLQLLSPDVV